MNLSKWTFIIIYYILKIFCIVAPQNVNYSVKESNRIFTMLDLIGHSMYTIKWFIVLTNRYLLILIMNSTILMFGNIATFSHTSTPLSPIIFIEFNRGFWQSERKHFFISDYINIKTISYLVIYQLQVSSWKYFDGFPKKVSTVFCCPQVFCDVDCMLMSETTVKYKVLWDQITLKNTGFIKGIIDQY